MNRGVRFYPLITLLRPFYSRHVDLVRASAHSLIVALKNPIAYDGRFKNQVNVQVLGWIIPNLDRLIT